MDLVQHKHQPNFTPMSVPDSFPFIVEKGKMEKEWVHFTPLYGVFVEKYLRSFKDCLIYTSLALR